MVLIKFSIFLSMLGEPIISRFKGSPVLLIFKTILTSWLSCDSKVRLTISLRTDIPHALSKFLSTPVLTSDVRFLFCLIELSFFSRFFNSLLKFFSSVRGLIIFVGRMLDFSFLLKFLIGSFVTVLLCFLRGVS